MIIKIKSLSIPKWHFGRPLTKDEEFRFYKCLTSQESYGIITIATPASTVPQDRCRGYYIIDGVKRVNWLRQTKKTNVICDYLGILSDTEMILASYRLNYWWKAIDIIKFAELLKEKVLPEIGHPHILANQFPDEYKDIDRLLNLLKFDWSQFDKEKALTSFF